MNAAIAQTKFGKVFSFAVAGGAGFVTDMLVLYALLNFTPFGPFSARIISIIFAMIANFTINRTFTFGKSDKSLLEEVARYSTVGLIGAVLNYLVYVVLLLAIQDFSPFLASLIAVILVSIFSFFGYSRFVFRS